MTRVFHGSVFPGSRTFLLTTSMLLLIACARKPEPMSVMDESRNPLCRSPLDNMKLAVLEPSELPPGFLDRTRTMQGKNPDFKVYLTIPGMVPGEPGDEVYNRALDSLILQVQMEFLLGLDPEPEETTTMPSSSLDLIMRSVWADSGLVSVKLPFESYHRGAAHPFSTDLTLVVDRIAGRVMKLEDLFLPASPWLEELSRRSTDELSARLADSFFPEGTRPTADNFRHWLVNRQTLTLLFGPYQVAPWSAGPQEVQIPLKDLQTFLAPGIAKP